LFYLSVRDSSITPRRRSRVQYGDTVDVADDEEEHLMGGRAGATAVDFNGLPPKWVDISDEIEDILGKVTSKGQ
jgi:syntaxin 16